VGRKGRQSQQGNRGLRRVMYLAAWLYLCAWIVALSLGRLPAEVRFASIGVAAAAILLIVLVLVEPHPTQTPVIPSRSYSVKTTD
jgi:hypothetical protein